MRRSLLSVVFGVATVAAIGQAMQWPILTLGFFVRGETDCGIVETSRAVKRSNEVPKRLEEIKRVVKVMARDERFTQYHTPIGDYWGPPDVSLLGSVYENQADNYGVHDAKGMTVIDVGANIGTFSRRVLAAGAAKVVAIEASPDTAEALRRNLAGDIEAGKVIVVPKAAWSSKGTLNFSTGGGMGNAVLEKEHAPDEIIVESDTIDAMVAALGLGRVDMIKMDIEGSESQALRGAAGTIRQFRPKLLIAMEHRTEDLTAIPALVKSMASYEHVSPGPCILQPMRRRVSPEFLRFE